MSVHPAAETPTPLGASSPSRSPAISVTTTAPTMTTAAMVIRLRRSDSRFAWRSLRSCSMRRRCFSSSFLLTAPEAIASAILLSALTLVDDEFVRFGRRSRPGLVFRRCVADQHQSMRFDVIVELEGGLHGATAEHRCRNPTRRDTGLRQCEHERLEGGTDRVSKEAPLRPLPAAVGIVVRAPHVGAAHH